MFSSSTLPVTLVRRYEFVIHRDKVPGYRGKQKRASRCLHACLNPTPDPMYTRIPKALLVACLALLPALSACSSSTASMSTASLSRATIMQRMSGWSMASRTAATFMMDKYGMPMELTATTATWGATGPWKRTIISSTEIPHAFPAPHTDVMEQFVDYRVAPEMVDDLAMYDGSVIVERTKGEMSARCDLEAANFLALNLADEIVRGRRTAQDARTKYGEQIMMKKQTGAAPYADRLLFTPQSGTMDADQPLMMPRN